MEITQEDYIFIRKKWMSSDLNCDAYILLMKYFPITISYRQRFTRVNVEIKCKLPKLHDMPVSLFPIKILKINPVLM